MMSGLRCAIERSIARVITSPTTAPTLPPMNFSSRAQMLTARPLNLPEAEITASLSEVAFCIAARRAG